MTNKNISEFTAEFSMNSSLFEIAVKLFPDEKKYSEETFSLQCANLDFRLNLCLNNESEIELLKKEFDAYALVLSSPYFSNFLIYSQMSLSNLASKRSYIQGICEQVKREQGFDLPLMVSRLIGKLEILEKEYQAHDKLIPEPFIRDLFYRISNILNNLDVQEFFEVYGFVEKIETWDTAEKIQEIVASITFDKNIIIQKLIIEIIDTWYQRKYVELLKNKLKDRKDKGNLMESMPFKWTGKVPNEFVQWAYAAFEAGYINNQEGQIVKLVEDMAQAFGVEIGKNWQGNHSGSIHKNNSDYKPPIFQKMDDAYNTYAVKRRKEKQDKQN